jgi:UDP-2,4-diacetamido-2,4,6-trideoxy-beta-L-altropyranose hydrolase
MGHVMRCFSLGRELSDRGAKVHLISRSLPPELADTAQTLGFVVLSLADAHDAEATSETLRHLAPVDLLIVDHYQLDAQWERAVRPLVSRLMVLDDAPSRPHNCDVLLDQNYSAAGADRYAALVPHSATVLLGPAYALIRREFQQVRALRKTHKSGVRTILVSFGGYHASHLIELVIATCSAPPLASLMAGGELHIFGARRRAGTEGKYPFHVHWHHFSSDIAAFMGISDVAIGGGGGALWERLCVGLPSMVTILAENQRSGVEALAADGYVANLGHAERLNSAHLASALCELWSDDKRMQEMSARGRKLVDGEGAQRVARVLVP